MTAARGLPKNGGRQRPWRTPCASRRQARTPPCTMRRCGRASKRERTVREARPTPSGGPMSESVMFHDGNRRLQDQFDSRRISDRLEEKLTRTAFTADDKAFIERAIYFFISTADAE